MSKDANSFGHDKALAWESRGFVYTKKRMHRFDTPSFFCIHMGNADLLNSLISIHSQIAKLFFDTKQLIVFSHTV